MRHPPPPISIHQPQPNRGTGEAKAYWQHAGEIVSSRKARHVLAALGHPPASLTDGKFPLPGVGEYGEAARWVGVAAATGAGDVEVGWLL